MKGIDQMLKDAQQRLDFINRRRTALNDFVQALEKEATQLQALISHYKQTEELYEAFFDDPALEEPQLKVTEKPQPLQVPLSPKHRGKVTGNTSIAIMAVMETYKRIGLHQLIDKVKELYPEADKVYVNKLLFDLKRRGLITSPERAIYEIVE